MRIVASTEIDRPIDSVWAFIVDPANNPKWDPGTIAVQQTSAGPLGVGTILIATVDLLGRRDLELRISAFEPSGAVAFDFLSGPVTGTRVRYGVEAVEGGRTRLTRTAELRLRGPWVVLWPLVGWSARRHQADEVESVKHILESSQRE